MIKTGYIKNTQIFRAGADTKDKSKNQTRLLPDNLKTELKQSVQKTESAFIDYPVKGLNGDVNSNFYEFLTMGIIPYVIGSLMMMFTFNAVNKFLDSKSSKLASRYGNKMAMGVLLYGIFKTLSQKMVTKPVHWFTGVNIDKPYENVEHCIPKQKGEKANIEILRQQRHVFDSKEFYRKDLLDKEYYEDVAKKLGYKEKLNDPASEMSPIIQNIISTTKTAKSISSYMFGALGVAFAVQQDWDKFFDAVKNREKLKYQKGFKEKSKTFGKNSLNIIKFFGKSFVGSIKSTWSGNKLYNWFMKHSGKALIITVIATTAGLTANSIIKAKHCINSKNQNTIDKSKESVVI